MFTSSRVEDLAFERLTDEIDELVAKELKTAEFKEHLEKEVRKAVRSVDISDMVSDIIYDDDKIFDMLTKMFHKVLAEKLKA